MLLHALKGVIDPKIIKLIWGVLLLEYGHKESFVLLRQIYSLFGQLLEEDRLVQSLAYDLAITQRTLWLPVGVSCLF